MKNKHFTMVLLFVGLIAISCASKRPAMTSEQGPMDQSEWNMDELAQQMSTPTGIILAAAPADGEKGKKGKKKRKIFKKPNMKKVKNIFKRKSKEEKSPKEKGEEPTSMKEKTTDIVVNLSTRIVLQIYGIIQSLGS